MPITTRQPQLWIQHSRLFFCIVSASNRPLAAYSGQKQGSWGSEQSLTWAGPRRFLRVLAAWQQYNGLTGQPTFAPQCLHAHTNHRH
jgi:hypothetical protein